MAIIDLTTDLKGEIGLTGLTGVPMAKHTQW